MAEEERGQVPAAEGQEPEPETQIAEGQEPEAKTFDAEYVAKLRKEAAEYRKKMRELEKALKAKEEAELSEQEKLQRRLAEYEAKLADLERDRQERTLKYEVKLKASKLGVVDPDAAWKLLDPAALEFDEDGNPTNIEDALKALIKEKPYLAREPVPSVSPTNPPRKTAVFTRSQLRDPAFYAAHREEIIAAMREGRIKED